MMDIDAMPKMTLKYLLTTAINRNCDQISINFPWNISFMEARQNAGKPLQYYRHELLSQVLYQVESTSVHCNPLHCALWPPGLTYFIWEYGQSLHLMPYVRCNFPSMSSLKWWFSCMVPHCSGIYVWADNNNLYLSRWQCFWRVLSCAASRYVCLGCSLRVQRDMILFGLVGIDKILAVCDIPFIFMRYQLSTFIGNHLNEQCIYVMYMLVYRHKTFHAVGS